MAQFHPFSIGRLQCTSLADFARERTPRETFPRIDPDELQKEFAAGGYGISIDDPMSLHGVALLIEDGEQKILIDSGLADAGLTTSLAAAGHSPEEIDLVVVTHGDGDHIGGLGNFPRARIVMPTNSYKLWTGDPDGMVEEFLKLFRDSVSAEDLAATAKGRRAFHDVINALQASGRLTLVDPGEEIAAGITFLPTPGHRRDHVAVLVESDGEVLIHVADAFRHPVQLRRSDFHCLFDSYPDLLAQSMTLLFEMAVERDATLFGAHFNFPAIIKLTKEDDGYQWIELG